MIVDPVLQHYIDSNSSMTVDPFNIMFWYD